MADETNDSLDEDPKLWGKVRNDFLTHERTGCFGCVRQSIFLQCRAANRMGVLQRSMQTIARKASGDGTIITVTVDMVEKAIASLVEANHCIWFRELETLWWVNMADEQAPSNPSAISNYWAQLRTQVVPQLENQLRKLAIQRYPELARKKRSDDESVQRADIADLRQVGLFLPDKDVDEDPDEDEDEPPTSGSVSPQRRSMKSRVHGTFIDAVIGAFNERRSRIVPNARGIRQSSKKQRGYVRVATKRERATLDDWTTRIDNLVEACRRDEFWLQHLSLEHLHRPKNWDKWGDESRLPPKPRSPRGPGGSHGPSDFSGPDESFGVPDDDNGEQGSAA